jgi:magnesium transporter
MALQTLKGKGFTWWHFSELEEADFATLEKEFKFHPLDFDDLRDETELAKLDEYKHYLFTVLNIPGFDVKSQRVERENLSVFIGKDYIVTATKHRVESVERFFARAKRSSGLRRDAMSKTSGYFFYKLLDYVFRDVQVVLRELVREADHVEGLVYDRHTRVTTKRLGILRRNVLSMRQQIDPQRNILKQYKNISRAYMPKDLEIYFDDVGDTLEGLWVVLDNLKSIVDGLFDVNEAFLSHRTNDIIRILTVISVVLMPPTLITGYYGMNVEGLPQASNIWLVSGLVVFSLFAFWLFVVMLDRRRK